MDGLTVGRMVHWVCDRVAQPANNKQTHMAAIVTHVWDKERGLVNLFVPPDMCDVREPITPTSVMFDSVYEAAESESRAPRPGTWHWIEKA